MSEERSPSWVDQTAESIVDGKPIDWASLDLEDAEARWLRGEDVFAAAAVHPTAQTTKDPVSTTDSAG